MLNADDTSVITTTLDGITDKNLFAYCDNNPIMREDSRGDFWSGLALAGGGTLGGSWIISGANFWNPIGWTILGVTAIAIVGVSEYQVYCAKSKAHKGRPELKKQGREALEKKKGNPNYKQNPNKRQQTQPRPHHPSKKGHRKYPQN